MIGERIKSARKLKGLTQKDIATTVGVSQTAVSKWESSTDEPKGKHLDKLCELLGTSSSYILYGRGEAETATTDTPSPAPASIEPKIPLVERVGINDWVEYGNWGGKWVSQKPLTGMKLSPKTFAYFEDLEGMSPMINPGDLLYIDPEALMKPGTLPALFLVNGRALLGQLKEAGAGYTLHFLNPSPGWESMQISKDQYLGSVICYIPSWLN